MFRGVHLFGVFLIIAAAVLLLVSTITSPVFNNLALAKVALPNGSHVTFGSFGYCIQGGNYCSPKSIGYHPADVMAAADGSAFTTAGTDTANSLTNAFILFPIACGVAFIGGVLAIGGFFGSLIGSMVCIVAWLITVVVMAINFAVFGIIKDHVNGDGSGSHAYYSVGTWTALAAMIALFFGTIIVFLTCCSERRRPKGDYTYERSHRRRW